VAQAANDRPAAVVAKKPRKPPPKPAAKQAGICAAILILIKGWG
jgi:hypothetical protein